MTDEIFRDGFCDDIFRSMKAQMEPSDDVVASLLAKIAAEAPSSVTENDNVIPFRQPAEIKAEETAASALAAELESAPRKHFANKKKTNKSIWYYGTAVAASIIVMISTFALLGTDGDDASGMKDLFEQTVGPDTQIAGPLNPGDETRTAEGDGTQNPADGEGENDFEGGNDELSSNSGEGDGGQTSEGDGSGRTDSSNGSQGNENPSGNSAASNNPKTDGSENSSVPDSNTQQPDNNGKVTPGASGTADLPWTSEIISNSQVASISVSGGNYVVGNTVSRSDVGETLEVVTITLPQTSTTNAAEVTAKVRELRKVSAEAMVALDVEGFDQPLIYANADYAPETLGDFVNDLGLAGNTTFSSTVRCQIIKVGYSANHNYQTDISSAVWEYLLNQSGAARTSYDNFSSGNSKALFTSSSNPTGSQIQFGVSDNGYLYVSMLGKKHTFQIGSENAKGFIEYVTGESLE